MGFMNNTVANLSGVASGAVYGPLASFYAAALGSTVILTTTFF